MKFTSGFARRALISILALALFSPLILKGVRAGAFLTVSPPLAAPPKSSVTLDDDDDVRRGAQKANVLFVLDVGSAMTFTPIGTMPEWNVNVNNTADANAMLAQATYGHGGLPVVGTIPAGAYDGRSRYGRERDATNNMTPGNTDLANHANNYYSPFKDPNNPYSTTAKPYALVFRNTAWHQNAPANFTADDLVPNDSRMYKMKLVMWRVLSNTVVIENLRVGMATTFQEINASHSQYGADFYKMGPLDGKWNNGNTGPGNFGITNTWTNGTGPDWATGIAGSGGYADATAAFSGIDRTHYERSHTDYRWKLLNRAYLRVPIAESTDDHIANFRLWIDGYEDINPTIGNSALPYYFRNPELFGDGKTYLSTAIYPGHPDLLRPTMLTTTDLYGTKGVVFSNRTSDTIASITNTTTFGGTTPGGAGNYFKAGSGEALGTVLDFFSPPVSSIGGVTTDAQNVKKAPASSFPLQDPCEKNWVILFTAGDDSGDDAGSAGFTSAIAVQKLFEATKQKELTKLKLEGTGSGDNQFETIKPDDGVRTLVVGFVDPDSTAPNVVALRTKLNAIAVAGDPGNDEAHAFFANDVEGLMHALLSILARINSDIQPAKGAMLEGDSFGDEDIAGGLNDTVMNLYAGSYRINNYDQWEGSLSRYESLKHNDGSFETTRKWELGERLRSQRNSSPGSRKLVFWGGAGLDGRNFKDLAYTPLADANKATQHPIMSAPYSVNFVPPIASMDTDVLPSGNFTGRMHPSRALVNWYYGKETAYAAADQMFDRRFMLSDQGNSGISKVTVPQGLDSLPGFKDFVEDQEAASPPITMKLYFQTNDGLLHVVDAATGDEEWAILPPPSLMPYRLLSLKTTTDSANGLYRWINVSGFLTTTSDDIPITSIPAFTLDGPLQTRYFNMGAGTGAQDNGSWDWKSYLFGTLGRGGGGIYAMDVTTPSAPAFLWYRETQEDENGPVHLYRQGQSDGVDPRRDTVARTGTYWSGVYAAPDDHPFEQLGFNSPRPYFGVAKKEETNADSEGFYNIISLAGGMQNYLDLNDNGKMGAAWYLIDPKWQYHTSAEPTPGDIGIRTFNNGSYSTVPNQWRVSAGTNNGTELYMGMMNSETTFMASEESNYISDGVFAVDNFGNIHAVSFVDWQNERKPLRRDDWNIRTIGTLRLATDAVTDSYSVPAGVIGGSRVDTGEKWVSGGTSNVGTKGRTDDNITDVKNKLQMIFSFKMPDLKDAASQMSRRANWTSVSSDGTDGMAENAIGWYIPLLPEGAEYYDEYVTIQPVMFGGVLYAATFRQKKLDTAAAGACETGNILGQARLFAVDMDSGKAAMWGGEGQKALEFDGVKFTGFTVSEKGTTKTLLITYDMLDTAAANASLNTADAAEEALTRSTGDLDFLSVTLSDGGGTGVTPLKENDGVVNYWLYTK